MKDLIIGGGSLDVLSWQPKNLLLEGLQNIFDRTAFRILPQ